VAKALSVVIPSRNELKNLLWTLQALQIELENINYEIIVVLNKCNYEESIKLSRYWPFQDDGRMVVLWYDEKASCWQARNEGAWMAQGDYLLFLDSHIMPKQNSLCNALKYHRRFKGILAFAVNYWLNHPARALYQYKWRPDKFWGDWSQRKPESPDYHIFMSGMNLMINREIFEEIGGFHPALGIYGGGEPYIYLKTQMFGYEARCNPAFQIYHLTEKRGYSWNNDDLWRNFMIAAWALGGEEALAPLYANYIRCCKGVPRYLERLEELKIEATKLAEADRLNTAKNAILTFKEILNKKELI